MWVEDETKRRRAQQGRLNEQGNKRKTNTNRQDLREEPESLGLFVPQEGPDNDNDDDDEVMETTSFTASSAGQSRRMGPPRQNRQRLNTTTLASSPQSSRTSFMTPPPTPSTAPLIDDPVKTELESMANSIICKISNDDKVRIYVGRSAKGYELRRADLEKSPILNSWLCKGCDEVAYIMKPELLTVDVRAFGSAREFLFLDEYTPTLVDNPAGAAVLPRSLEGCTTVDDHRAQALRSAHVYCLAKRLGMLKLQVLAYKKISTTRHSNYGVSCMLDLAAVIFSRPDDASFMVKKGKERALDGDIDDDMSTQDDEDKMEKWLVQQIAGDFRLMMESPAHAKHFFHVAEDTACADRNFAARVLKASIEKKSWRKPPVVLEDDDK
jgi:hypothetical protein